MKNFLSVFVLILMATPMLSFGKIYRPKDSLHKIYANEARELSAEELQALSLREYQDFVNMETNTYESHPNYNVDEGKPVTISADKAEMVLNATNRNPVVSTFYYEKYDPESRGIGFCFGRAMFIDFYLSINGLNRASIKKAFVVGSMVSGGTTWGWHVTTIAQSVDSEGKEIWLTIDPFVWIVMDVTEWYERMLTMSRNGKLRLYITDAGKFGPTPSRYDEIAITNPFYNAYFIDMMKWFDENDVSQELGL